jgi:hypothetical protein
MVDLTQNIPETDEELTENMLNFLNGNDKSIKIAVPLKKLCVKIIVSFECAL